MSTMRHGVILLPEQRWSHARRLWTHAEELGFDHAWTYDHLMWRWFREKPWFGAVPTLAAAAEATSRIGLGTMVAGPSYRHPVTFAKELMTLDDISDGRLICGLGAGAGGHDDRVLGHTPPSPAERHDRFAEFVEMIDLLLRRRVTDHRGAWFEAHGAFMVPGCVQRPRLPLAIAATGPRGIRLAARHADIWVTAGDPGWGEPSGYASAIANLRTQTQAFDAACADIGRDPSTVRRLVVTGAMITGVIDAVDAYEDACGLFADIGFTDLVVHWPRADFPYQGSPEVVERIAGKLFTSTGTR
ncbi:luciferase [Embleya scabrispora]|uniref:Luciferase n=2 Tax=Embleya scabrispora TaxID=159449 RepID=A0A1T3NLM3_9ACTN|nr:luciferase [Embleya scabrispora]